VRIETTTEERSHHHKNLMPVTYVTGDVAGEVESPVYAIFELNDKPRAGRHRAAGGLRREQLTIRNAHPALQRRRAALKWDGEWHITIEVFRDLGWPSRWCWC
jgi:hypothetical protein